MSLPSLPVPSLEHTHQLFLKTMQPLLTSQEHKQLRVLADEFFKGKDAKELQQYLQSRASSEKTSWLHEWWENWGYLDGRDPVCINSNYILTMELDESPTDPISRAARLVAGTREFSEIIESGRLTPDYQHRKPQCMKMYHRMFNTCRVPGADRDAIYTHPAMKHLVVLRKEQFFCFDLYHMSSGAPLTIAELEQQLLFIRDQADATNLHNVFPVAAFTAINRTTWAKNRDRMLQLHQCNRDALHAIESSLFILCLDDRKPTSRDQVAKLLLHGDGRGMFFDKAVQIVVFDNGLSGVNAEHSPSDAPLVGRMVDYALGRSFGSDEIKKWKQSPDAIVQLAMQLAFLRTQGAPTATYETASTRWFAYGRTETIRSCSQEALDWAMAMDNSKKQVERHGLLVKAINGHKHYTHLANQGQGVDRHLLGMRLAAAQLGMTVPSFLQHPFVGKGTNFRLSTSNTSLKHAGGGGFGPVVADGYGACYGIHPHAIQITVSSFNAAPSTDAISFAQAIGQALQDIQQCCRSAPHSRL